MTKLLEQAIAQVRDLPDTAQDMAALELMRYLEAASDPRLSDEQLAEIRRRRADQKPKFLNRSELEGRLRQLGQ